MSIHETDLSYREAMALARAARKRGFVSINICYDHFRAKTGTEEPLYSVWALTKSELDEKIREDQEPEEPPPPFEIMRNYMEDGIQYAEIIHFADTLEELLKFTPPACTAQRDEGGE